MEIRAWRGSLTDTELGIESKSQPCQKKEHLIIPAIFQMPFLEIFPCRKTPFFIPYQLLDLMLNNYVKFCSLCCVAENFWAGKLGKPKIKLLSGVKPLESTKFCQEMV